MLYVLIDQLMHGLWLPKWRSSRQMLQIQHYYVGMHVSVGVRALKIFSFGYVKNELFPYGFDDKGKSPAMDMCDSVQKNNRILKRVNLDQWEPILLMTPLHVY